MSLINQALRKAQRDRTPNRMPQAGEQSQAAYASSVANGMSPMLVIGLVIAVALLVGLVVGLSIVIFKGDPTPTRQGVASPVITTLQSAPLAEPSRAVPAPIKAPHAAPPATAPAEPAATTSVVEELRKAREATEAEAAAQAKATAAAAAKAAAQPSEDIIEWLGSAKLSGVRISETESKVIVNGNAYAVGEYVNFKLGLKVLIIQETRVLFVDNNGKKYMKRL